MKRRAMRGRILTVAVLAILGAGCASLLAPQPETTRFFVLNAVDATRASQATATGGPRAKLAIGLGPIDFPEYLARTEFVTRTAANQVLLSATDRWAEPLDVTFKRVLANDLAGALDGAQITVFPWFGVAPHFAYRVAAVIDRFDADAQGKVSLVSRWTLLDGATGHLLYSSTTEINLTATPGDHAAIAAALSQATGQFADAIASAIRRLQVAAESRPSG